MKTKLKLDVDVFVRAAELMEQAVGGESYACHGIQTAKGLDINESSPERKFFGSIFGLSEADCEFYSFGGMWYHYFSTEPSGDLRNVRVLALLFAAEIARLKNNKK